LDEGAATFDAAPGDSGAKPSTQWQGRVMTRQVTSATVLLLSCCLLGACTITVTPPSAPAPAETVYLVDQEHSASLVLPDGRRLVRYIYAEWDYYALGHKDASGALHAVLVPSQATLARRTIRSVRSVDEVSDALEVEVEAVYAVRVERSRVQALVQRLNRIYAAGASERIYDPDTDLGFVPYPGEAYHLLHNSNTVIAQWLGKLGCEVDGLAILSRWRVRRADAVHRPAPSDSVPTPPEGK
jgi:hypothetical protein